MCGGDMDEVKELAADSNFERTFGAVETCPTAAVSEYPSVPIEVVDVARVVEIKDFAIPQ